MSRDDLDPYDCWECGIGTRAPGCWLLACDWHADMLGIRRFYSDVEVRFIVRATRLRLAGLVGPERVMPPDDVVPVGASTPMREPEPDLTEPPKSAQTYRLLPAED